jgi:hypothetical protein
MWQWSERDMVESVAELCLNAVESFGDSLRISAGLWLDGVVTIRTC